MPLEIENCLQQFAESKPSWLKLNDYLVRFLTDLCADGKIMVHAISGRIKDEASLKNKLTRADKTYQDLSNITDLCGIRIITYLQNEVDKVGELIESEFNVDRERSVDKRIFTDPDRFGYSSLHYIAGLRKDRLSLREYASFNGMAFEIQVRSIIQHAWAEIEHNFGYKSETAIPHPVKRRFSRLAALLELADQEFSGLSQEVVEYKVSVTAKVKKKSPAKPGSELDNIVLDVESLKILIRQSVLIRDIDREIVEGTLHSIGDRSGDTNTRIEALRRFKIGNLFTLTKALNHFRLVIVGLANTWLRTSAQRQEISPGISLFYLCYCLAAESQNLAAIKDYLKFAHIAAGKEDALAEKLLGQFTELVRKHSIPLSWR